MLEKLYGFSFVKRFSCKCGHCRNTCCEYWNIAINYHEYLRLAGITLKKALRKKLDEALSIIPDGTEERYAYLNLNYEGKCLLLDENGFCLLQEKAGEKSLPLVCRVYPRSFHLLEGHYEVALSNSCEKVLEFLLEDDKPLTLELFDGEVNNALKLEIPYEKKHEVLNQVSVLFSDRTKTILARLSNLRNLLFSYESGKEFEESAEPYMIKESEINGVISLLKETSRRNFYLSNIVSSMEIVFDKNPKNVFLSGLEELYQRFPSMEIYLEKILFNHLFYECFPFTDSRLKINEEFYGLLGTYYFIMLSLIAMKPQDSNSLIDLLGLIFRKIEHSDYYFNCYLVLHD